MRIAYITDQLYLHGGAERVLTNKVNYLASINNVSVFIITNEQKSNQFCYKIDSKVIHIDIDSNYNREKSYFSITNLIKAPSHFFKLKKTLKHINPDIIITLSSQFDYYFLPFVKAKIPIIKEFHSSRHYYWMERKNSGFIKNLVYKLNDFTESKYTLNAILTQDENNYFKSDNTVVFPNALTSFPNSFSSVINKKIISAGRIAPVKGFEKLIEAWKIVSTQSSNLDWILEIYGNGDENYIEELNCLITKMELNNSCFIRKATHELETKMREASIYVMSSSTECFPMVLLEAMSIGLPIISFDCPNGPKNIIAHNTDGLLVENGNTEELAKTIIKLVNDKDLRIEFGNNGKKNALKYDKEIIMKNWLNLFDRLILKR